MVLLTAGVDIGGTKVLAAVVDEAGRIVKRASHSTDRDAGTASIIAALEDLLGRNPDQVSAIGVAAAAFVERASGRVAFAPNLTYDQPDVPGALKSRFGMPVAVENDANAAAWGEHRFGAGKGAAEMIMVTVGTGVGGGIVIGGKLYRGSRGFAGEIGHMTIVDGGPPCACGERGCLEALASGTAIARMAREGVGGASDSILLELAGDNPARITGALVGEAARAGDPFATEVLERAGRWLGAGFANLTNILDPEVIVVGGGAAASGYHLVEPARLELSKRVRARRDPPDVVIANLGNDAGVIGAADLARAGTGSAGA